MKTCLNFILLMLFSIPAFSQINEEAKTLKNDIVKQLFTNNISKPVKIAVLDFDEKSEDAKKSKVGSVFSSALSEQFIKDRDFIVAERQKLENVFKELKLSAMGVIDEKELKRTGLILGVDWLIVGDISDSGENFLIQARIVNSETAQALAAANVIIERGKLIKESEEFYSKKYRTFFYLTGGKLNISDLNFDINMIGAQIRRKLNKNYLLEIGISKNTGEKSETYLQKHIPVYITGGGNMDIVFCETFKSISTVYSSLNYSKNIFGLNLNTGLGISLNFATSNQKYYDAQGGTGFGTDIGTGLRYALPASYEQKYYIPSLNLKASVEKKFNSFIVGIDAEYSYLFFKRNFSPPDENSLLGYYAKPLNKKITISSIYLGLKFGFGF